MIKKEKKMIKKCHWCCNELYENEIEKLDNARGYGYYIFCKNCGNRNVIQEIDLTRDFWEGKV